MMKNADLKKVIRIINKYADEMDKERINIMEVCGTHTHSIAEHGIRNVVSSKINLLSGPGCPVCVTSEDYVDAACEVSKDAVVATFGDLMRTRGNKSSLATQKSRGRDIRTIYSLSQVIDMACEVQPRNVVVLGVGFETTAPLVASVIKEADVRGITNLFFLTSIKLMPPMLERLLGMKNKNIDGIICPGNVSVITGADEFKFIYEKHGVPSVICGFEAEDILGGICFLVRCMHAKEKNMKCKGFENLYRRWVRDEGNQQAKALVHEVFDVGDAVWRGMGNVENSALVINDEYSYLDAVKRFNLEGCFEKGCHGDENHAKGCRCTDVLLGNMHPFQCSLFGKACTPENPCGPCMTSGEGACATYWKFSLWR